LATKKKTTSTGNGRKKSVPGKATIKAATPKKPAKKTTTKPVAKPKTKTKAAARPKKTKDTESDSGRVLALAVAAAGLENKAINVEIIDVRGKVDYADYVVVMSGRGERQVAALAGYIERAVSLTGVRCSGIEGLPQGAWVLMDYGDVIVHIFHEDTRGYYDLEALWIDAARVSVD
jgi:ribosome-associated protein